MSEGLMQDSDNIINTIRNLYHIPPQSETTRLKTGDRISKLIHSSLGTVSDVAKPDFSGNIYFNHDRLSQKPIIKIPPVPRQNIPIPITIKRAPEIPFIPLIPPAPPSIPPIPPIPPKLLNTTVISQYSCQKFHQFSQTIPIIPIKTYDAATDAAIITKHDSSTTTIPFIPITTNAFTQSHIQSFKTQETSMDIQHLSISVNTENSITLENSCQTLIQNTENSCQTIIQNTENSCQTIIQTTHQFQQTEINSSIEEQENNDFIHSKNQDSFNNEYIQELFDKDPILIMLNERLNHFKKKLQKMHARNKQI